MQMSDIRKRDEDSCKEEEPREKGRIEPCCPQWGSICWPAGRWGGSSRESPALTDLGESVGEGSRENRPTWQGRPIEFFLSTLEDRFLSPSSKRKLLILYHWVETDFRPAQVVKGRGPASGEQAETEGEENGPISARVFALTSSPSVVRGYEF